MKTIPLSDLNEPQREAVCYDGGPLLVLAGAGSGKTRVVTYRIARLILEKGVHPGRILAVTFTNKAANEMLERVHRLAGDRAKGLWIGTFHAMCSRMLRRFADRLGYSRDFSIYDSDEQKAVIKQVLKNLSWSTDKWTPSKVNSQISKAKNQLISQEKMAATAGNEDQRVLSEIYRGYEEALRTANALDFDDLLLRTVELLADHEDVRFQFQTQFEHLIVDEYQDTNEPQDIITRVLAQPQDNLCVVGDDDQSIYRWRGARFKNILELPKRYENLKVIRLEQNYRSTGNILSVAKSVISNNKDRHKKEIWTGREPGDSVRLLAAETEEDEANQVVALIDEALKKGVPPKEIGVLYRTNAQSRVLEEALLRKQIPYKIVGGFAFYQRREVKVLLSYMKMLIAPHDDLSFLRIVNNPRRGIGQTTLRQLQAKAGSLKLSLFETAKNASNYSEIGSAGAHRLQDLCRKIDEWASTLEEVPLAETLNRIVRDIDYETALKEEDKTKAEARIENVRELIAAFLIGESEITYETIRPWDTQIQSKTPSRAEKLEVFLERATLQSRTEGTADEDEAVLLMTLHAAKGLEFSYVFITGMEEGLFPHEQSMWNQEELEEERRLCYVGMTRAKDCLTLSYAHNRRMYDRSSPGIRSRFLEEIPEELLTPIGVVPEFEEPELSSLSNASWSKKSPVRPPGGRAETRDSSLFEPKPCSQSESSPSPPLFLQPGKVVRHRTFGLGYVVAVEGNAPSWRITVDFKIVGRKTLLQKYADLEPA